jgi:hypothetical protein
VALLHVIALRLFLPSTRVPIVRLYRKVVDSDDLYGPMEVDDDLSTAMGTETLAEHS